MPETLAGCGPRYRSKLLPLHRAASFARALSANSRFLAVEIQESPRAKGDKRWFVRYLPSNAQRVQAMVDRQQQAREERAAKEPFTFAQDPDHPFLWCHSHSSGEVYEVTARDCSCPDFTFHAKPLGLVCKHIIAGKEAVARGEVQTFQAIPERSAA